MKVAEEKAEKLSKSSEDMSNLQQSLLAKDAELCKLRHDMNELKKDNNVSIVCEIYYSVMCFTFMEHDSD